MNTNVSSKISNLLDSGSVAEAQALLDTSGTDIGPHEPYFRGVIAFKQGELGQAEKWFRESVGADPGNHKAIYYLGCVLEQQGDEDAAARNYKTVHALAPDFAPAKRRLEELGKLPESRRMSDLDLPATDEALEEYAKRKLAKEKTDFLIENWHKYPKGYKIFAGVFIAIFATIFLSVIIVIVSAIIGRT